MMFAAETPDRIGRLADLLKLSARSIRWMAQLSHTPSRSSTLLVIADDVERIASRLELEGQGGRSEQTRLN